MNKKLQIVDHTTWRHKELAEGPLEVIRSFGLDVPAFEDNDIWWMPQEFAVDLNYSLEFHNMETVCLSSPGPHLLINTPQKITHRQLYFTKAKYALAHPAEGWWKAAEAKVDDFPSAWRTKDELVKDIEEAKLDPQTALHYTTTKLDIKSEHRVYFVNGRATTSSPYLEHNSDGTTTSAYDERNLEPLSLEETYKLYSFLNIELRVIRRPKSMVVDVALLKNGKFAVLEYNPTWCSAWYDCDIDKVIEALELSINDTSWNYVPDPYLINKAKKRPPLVLSPQMLARTQ